MPFPDDENINDLEKAKFGKNANGDRFVRVSLDNTIDIFGRQSVANPATLIDYSGNGPFDEARYIATKFTGSGIAAKDANEPSIKLTTTTASGDEAIIQTRRSVHYFKGNAQSVIFTGRFSQLQENLRQRYGYFNENYGLFFEANGLDFRIVRRSKVTGSIVDHVIEQADWNGDTMDGSGDGNNPSGYTFDPTKESVFQIEFGWLGALGIRFYVFYGLQRITLHQESYSQIETLPYMDSGFNHIRMELTNTGTIAEASAMYSTCFSVQSGGEIDHPITTRMISTGKTPVSLTTSEVIVAGIRLNSNYISKSELKPYAFTVYASGGNNLVYYRVLYNPTLTSPTWAAGSEGTYDVLTNQPVFSGGSELKTGWLDSSKNASNQTVFGQTLRDDIWLGGDVDGNQDALVLVASTVASTAAVYFQGEFLEYT
jgi:hypothetical protein